MGSQSSGLSTIMEFPFSSALLPLLTLLCLLNIGMGKQCYDCGYMMDPWLPDGSGKPKPLPSASGIPFCGDDTTLESFTMECEAGEECCGSIREYFEKTVGGVTTTHMVGRHSCERELSGVGDYGVVCNGHTDACYNITRDQINTIEALWAEACFCSGDKCNTEVPNWSDPDQTTTPAAPGSAFHTTGSILLTSLISLIRILMRI